ncbi:tellurite resistance TerB family protein [Limibaculum sp. M0105]|uniref:Tellurite resistance TerB family protein n=1 Tax=Thermohalobaculum xanthum TaxID=2753746 RepID=A0A8J7M6A5_9RHOB|nr:tellurite resistance TerB family protein [Thermohalobaculum xanthum]MBK0398647.1 tellurite resistance TerB family protein [Thermohalobaculum xanthum]
MTIDSLSPQDALVAVMIAVSAADERVSDRELAWIFSIIDILPVFQGYDRDRVSNVIGLVHELFEDEDGIDALVGLVDQALPDHLHETAYALACDVSAADGKVEMTELRLLEILRYDLGVDRLTSAAIERGARARHQRLEPRESA